MQHGAAALPPLRDELELVAPAKTSADASEFFIYDPLRHCFFDITGTTYDLLVRWSAGTRERLLERVNRDTARCVSAADVDRLVEHLRGSQLLKEFRGRSRAASGPASIFFVKKRLFRPDRFFAALHDRVAFVFSRWAVIPFAAFAILSLVLLSRQWESFVHTGLGSFNAADMAAFIAALLVSKVFHEFGHALVAKHHGCRVSNVGVALLFGIPVVYTDVTDAWRVAEQRKRVAIGAAGIMGETVLAVIAIWGWLILPDGPARSACFFLAAAALVMTLAVNLNPFVRFDGYYILADAFGVKNLQLRSSRLAIATIERAVLGAEREGLGQTPWPARLGLVSYAVAMWIVRLSILAFLAVMAYEFLHKLIAVPLIVFGGVKFVARPILREVLSAVKEHNARAPRARALAALAVVSAGLLLVVLPQSYTLSLPAVMVPAERQWIYPPQPARLLDHVRPARGHVGRGDIVATFEDPELAHRIAMVSERIRMLEAAAEQAASTLAGAASRPVILQELARERAELSGLIDQQARLSLAAPFGGRLVEYNARLLPGRWFEADEALFLLVHGSAPRVRAYVSERDAGRIVPGSPATFHPETPEFPSLDGRVASVNDVPAQRVGEPLLLARFEGTVRTDTLADGTEVPKQAHYEVVVELEGVADSRPDHVMRGEIHVESTPFSLARAFADRLRAFVIRESGL